MVCSLRSTTLALLKTNVFPSLPMKDDTSDSRFLLHGPFNVPDEFAEESGWPVGLLDVDRKFLYLSF